MCSRPFRPVGFPIYVARYPAAPFTRSYPRHFTFYVADPISSIPDLWQQEAVRALQQGKEHPIADKMDSLCFRLFS